MTSGPRVSTPPSRESGPTDTPLRERTIGEDLLETVATHGNREALVEYATGRRWSYHEFLAEVDTVARGLWAQGVRPGDRVGIWSPNRAEWTFVQYAAARLGAVLVTINPAYRVHELAYVLRQSGVRMVVATPSFKTSHYADMLAEARPDCPELRDVVLIGEDSYAELRESGGRTDPAILTEIGARLHPTDPINIQYTSGTTGFPKGATLSHRNILNNGFFVGELLHYSEGDRIAIPVPFYHCFGMVMGNLAATSHGATMVIPAPAFDPEATLAAVEAERCTSLYGVPTMFIAMLGLRDFERFDTSTLRTGIMAGSPCPTETMRQVISRMGIGEISICYGMTETSPVSMQTRTDDSLERRVSTVGRPGPHIEVKIVDPVSGETVPRGVAGELHTRGYSVMLGYWDQPERTAETIDDGGWLHTGDLAVMDDAGYANITGRIKDMVIRGGENLYPREVEEYLLTHPDIVDAQVIGVPDERYGEELMAWLQLREEAAPLDHEAVRAYCDGRLARHKIPRYVHVVEEFPMTVTGKVRKVQMRAEAWELLGLARDERGDSAPPAGT